MALARTAEILGGYFFFLPFFSFLFGATPKTFKERLHGDATFCSTFSAFEAFGSGTTREKGAPDASLFLWCGRQRQNRVRPARVDDGHSERDRHFRSHGHACASASIRSGTEIHTRTPWSHSSAARTARNRSSRAQLREKFDDLVATRRSNARRGRASHENKTHLRSRRRRLWESKKEKKRKKKK